MKNIVNDLSTLTLIPESVLRELSHKSELCIAHNVLENFKEHQTLSEINIGIGTLCILIDGDNLKYKFIPNDRFNEVLINTINTQSSPLTAAVESKLADKIMNSYKTLF